MTLLRTAATALLLLGATALSQPGHAADTPKDKPDTAEKTDKPAAGSTYFKAEEYGADSTVTVNGTPIEYHSVEGTLVVHPQGWDDAPKKPTTGGDDKSGGDSPSANPTAEAAMSFTAYFKKGVPANRRPVTFIYNGGPGSSTVWLHMGAFGPKRVVTADDTHSPAAPYRVVDNEFSLLDVSDLVFIDAPGTGFGHLRGADKEKAFYGVDQDAHAFANFIVEFLTKHARWNSPKYLFGESYGTTRSAAVAYLLQNEKSIDLNGVILLSQVLNFDDGVDAPQLNPGVDLPYLLALPTYTATAWYHHRLPNQPAELEPLLREVEGFALGDYAQALLAGATLSPERKAAIATRLHAYTGLPVDYIERANLRVNGGEFEKNLLGSETTAGRLDTRFAGPTIDPMSKEADYDPQSAAISSAYVSAFNDYVRTTLKFGEKKIYKADADAGRNWDFLHQPPGVPMKVPGPTNVMPDLAVTMQQNPNLKVQLNGGYYDLATPYFAAVYELRQLPIESSLQANIETHFYQSGHMVYAHEPALKELHTNVASFIEKTKNGAAK